MNNPTQIKQKIVRVALIIALVQFSNALEYMMINPIFSYIANDLDLAVSYSGYIAGAYTISSVLSGLAAFFFIDKYDKKRLLMINMAMLGLITALTPWSANGLVLLVLRLVAGLFGGLTLGVGMALLLNSSPEEWRGKMIAIVLSSFSAVSIVGLPLILYLSGLFGWHYAFWFVGLLCLLCIPLIYGFIPHSDRSALFIIKNETVVKNAATSKLLINRRLIFAAMANAIANFSPFLIIPILFPILTDIMRVVPEDVAQVFFMGGLSSYAGTRLAGKLSDRYGALFTARVATLIFTVNIALLLVGLNTAYLFMMLFMFSTYLRLVAASVMSSHFPDNAFRAGFNVLQSSMTNLFASAAFFIPAILINAQQISLKSINSLLILTLLSGLLLPFYLARLNTMLTESVRTVDEGSEGIKTD